MFVFVIYKLVISAAPYDHPADNGAYTLFDPCATRCTPPRTLPHRTNIVAMAFDSQWVVRSPHLVLAQ